MSTDEVTEVIRKVFRSVERRDAALAAEVMADDVELHWPPELPYGGVARGRDVDGPTWGASWNPLQPADAERSLDPRIVAVSDEEAVVLWRQRGLAPSGERIDTPVLGLYRVRDGKLVRGQMFYFDPAAAARFLSTAPEQ
jgi:ketosteroid isomerase-like protein